MSLLPGTERTLKRQKKIQEWEQRIKLLYQKYPRLAEIDRLYKQMAMDLALLGLGKNRMDMSAEELEQALNSLREEKKRILESQGISEKVFEVWWDCPKCQDLGYLSPGVKCSCLLKEEEESRLSRSGLAPEQRKQTFENFSLHYYAEPQKYKAILETCRTFAYRVSAGEKVPNLVLTGPVGTGKTHLSSAIANHVLAAGKAVLYIKIVRLLDLLREVKFQDKDFDNDLWQYITQVDLLIIDDLGTETLTDFAGEQILNILDERINYHLPFVLNTNLSPTELDAHYELRLVDRITGTSKFLVFSGDSIRQRKFIQLNAQE